ncbi:PilZ domain-containing protein [Sphingomonas segetis]|jgi:hypothetical protein|uniref:PilZ domain-containing protein n=1 Tax=Sphingomonas segetis TaxID=1104779 RepID=UPI0012D2FC73|nr:PilZ domain-containing protein [Sphingomonas segetis]
MNIRAKIFGAGSTQREPILQSKRSKGARSDSLDTVRVEREEWRRSDGRFEDRHRLLDEVVQVSRGDERHEVQLINLSGGGAMVSGEIELKLWDKVVLELGEEGSVECVVRWLRDGRFGLEFAHETRIDCGADQQAAILREVIRRSFPDVEFDADHHVQSEHSGPESRRERRHPLVWSGLLHHDYQSTPVRIRNISETGAMIDCPAMLTSGSEPLLEFGNGMSLSTKVAWVLGDQAGLRFDTPFDLHELSRSRPQVAGADWQPPSYLEAEVSNGSPWGDYWGRVSLGELRQDLEGFLKR